MSASDLFIEKKLQERRLAGTYRALKSESGLVDFCSNDYLGFARSVELRNKIEHELNAQGLPNGATGSRLLSGNYNYVEQLERDIAKQHNCEAALIFNSGYDANLGLFSSLPQRGNTIILDELAHASIIDGARLSFANRYTFKHNDLQSLEDKLKQAKGICYVAIESVYSMDGDSPPIAEILTLTEKYNAHLIVDEAHAVGVFGFGLVNDVDIQSRVFARVVTFGKALGCHGAVVLGSDLLRQYLINFARSFIYTTAAPPHNAVAVKAAYELLQASEKEIDVLIYNINLFKQKIKTSDAYPLIKSDSAIQCIVFKSNEKAKQVAVALQNAGLDVRAILSPTVPQGSERIRICLHSFNTAGEIELLTSTINKLTNE